MTDGNFLTALGFDLQLLTAGSAGGLVKAIFDKSRVVDAVTTMVAGALTANYLALPFAGLAGDGVAFGLKINLTQGVSGFLVGMFAVLIVSFIQSKLRSKLGASDGKTI